VKLQSNQSARQRGAMLTEIIVAIGILAAVSIPIAYSAIQERTAFRASYFRALAMEIVDGETEILMAGEWRAFQSGAQAYQARGEAVKNLPSGRFTLTVEDTFVRLEWMPEKIEKGGRVVREFKSKKS
jgi:hypothetical protein